MTPVAPPMHDVIALPMTAERFPEPPPHGLREPVTGTAGTALLPQGVPVREHPGTASHGDTGTPYPPRRGTGFRPLALGGGR